MKLSLQLLKTFLVWMLVLLVVILLVLMPRTMSYDITSEGVQTVYEFSWSEYGANLSNYFTSIWENKSLGTSRFNITVEEEISRYMTRSLYIIVTAFLISIPLGILKGIYDYRKTYTRRNLLGHGTTWFFQSLPDFFVIISVQWMILLAMRQGFPRVPIYGYDDWYSFITPALMVSLFPIMYMARMTSSALASTDSEQYIQTAKAKGLTERMIVYRHALANCWYVILTHFSSLMLYILSNLLMVEYLMFYKGAAYRLYEALGYHDSSLQGTWRGGAGHFEAELVIGLVLMFMVCVLVATLISQVAKYKLDPRWREEM